MEDTYKKAMIRMPAEGFNNAPALNIVEMEIAENKEFGDIEVVDSSDKDYWKNTADTLVVSVRKDDAKMVAELAKFAIDWSVDEFDHNIHKDRIIIRMWWD